MELQKKHVEPDIFVLEMAGSIHMGQECERIDKEIDERLRLKNTRVIFDLTRVTHIDSAAVGMIVRTHSRLKKSGGALRLAVGTSMVEGVLKMMQIHKVIPLYPTAADACAGFTGEKTES
jgi:anti-sigma B factor antagonist